MMITLETQKGWERAVEFNFYINCDRHKRFSQNEKRRAVQQNFASDGLAVWRKEGWWGALLQSFSPLSRSYHVSFSLSFPSSPAYCRFFLFLVVTSFCFALCFHFSPAAKAVACYTNTNGLFWCCRMRYTCFVSGLFLRLSPWQPWQLGTPAKVLPTLGRFERIKTVLMGTNTPHTCIPGLIWQKQARRFSQFELKVGKLRFPIHFVCVSAALYQRGVRGRHFPLGEYGPLIKNTYYMYIIRTIPDLNFVGQKRHHDIGRPIPILHNSPCRLNSLLPSSEPNNEK